MPRIGVSITKATAFRNATQEFSNVYYYEVTSLPSVAQADTIIDNLTAIEKTFHASVVTFVRGRLWSQGATKADSEMISQKNLTGTGARSSGPAPDKERAFLFRLRAGVDSRGNPVYLRKWFHACGEFVVTQGISAGVQQQTTGWTSGERTAQVAAMNGIGDANGSPLAPKLCAKHGRLPNAGALWEAHPWFEHHQLGDMWRAQ